MAIGTAEVSAPRASASAWWTLLVLAFVHVMSGVTRMLLVYLSIVITETCESQCTDAEFVNTCDECVDVVTRSCDACYFCRLKDGSEYYNLRDGACISATEYGVLAGFGFYLPFAVVMLMGGYLADRFNRKLLLTLALTFMGLGGAMQAWMDDFGGLLLARIIIGIGGALATPAAYSVMTDLFSQEQRGTAVGVFVAGLYIGQGLASSTMLLAQDIGWRDTSRGVSLWGAGLCLALLLLTVREPVRSEGEGSEGGGEGKEVGAVVPAESGGKARISGNPITAIRRDRTLLYLWIACVMRNLASQASLSFLPVFYSMAFPTYAGEYAVCNVVVIAVGGTVSAFGTGVATDLLAKTVPSARSWVPAIVSFLCCLLFVLVLVVDDFWASQAFYLLQIVVGEGWFAPMAATMQQRVDPGMAGSFVAFFVGSGTVLGLLAPTLMGVLIEEPDWSVQGLLLLFTIPPFFISGLSFAAAGQAMREAETLKSPLLPEGAGGAGGAGGGPASVRNNRDMGWTEEAVLAVTPTFKSRRVRQPQPKPKPGPGV